VLHGPFCSSPRTRVICQFSFKGDRQYCCQLEWRYYKEEEPPPASKNSKRPRVQQSGPSAEIDERHDQLSPMRAAAAAAAAAAHDARHQRAVSERMQHTRTNRFAAPAGGSASAAAAAAIATSSPRIIPNNHFPHVPASPVMQVSATSSSHALWTTSSQSNVDHGSLPSQQLRAPSPLDSPLQLPNVPSASVQQALEQLDMNSSGGLSNVDETRQFLNISPGPQAWDTLSVGGANANHFGD
jgi:hypothetical protein